MGLKVLSFDSKILWSDYSGKATSEVITLPDSALAQVALMEQQFLLEAPEDPKNPTVLRNSIYIYKFFGLR